MQSAVGVPANGAPTSPGVTEPSPANVTVVDALPHSLPRRHFATSRHLPSRARTAAALRNALAAGAGLAAGVALAAGAGGRALSVESGVGGGGDSVEATGADPGSVVCDATDGAEGVGRAATAAACGWRCGSA